VQVGLTLVSLVSKLAYSYDLGAWTFLEGMQSARSHPNILLWNVTRFNPFYCLLEVRSRQHVVHGRLLLRVALEAAGSVVAHAQCRYHCNSAVDGLQL
jgi:hypothetical protein